MTSFLSIERRKTLLSKNFASTLFPAVPLRLGACTEAPAMDTGDNLRVEAATKRIDAGQALTDRTAAKMRDERAAAHKYELALSLCDSQRGIRKPERTGR